MQCLELSPFSSIKVLRHLDRLAQTEFGPVTASIDLTNFCNHACLWCHSADYQRVEPGHLEPQLFYALIDSLAELQAKAISLTGGGEPTCHPAFADLLRYAFSKGLEVALVTNGSLLHRLDRQLLHSLRYLRISLDAGSPRSHQRLHRPKNRASGWEQIISNLRQICRNKPGTFTVGVGYLLHPANVHEAYQLALTLRELGVDYFQLRPIKFVAPLDTALVQRTYAEIKELETADFRVVETGYKYTEKPDKLRRCHVLPLIVNISPQGYVLPCCELKTRREYAYGNLRQQSFAEIWAGPKRQQVNKELNPATCPDCKYTSMNLLIEQVITADPLHQNFL